MYLNSNVPRGFEGKWELFLDQNRSENQGSLVDTC